MILALVAVAGVLGVPAARADEPEKLDVADEMAGALGYANSHAPGFWEELTKIKAEEREALNDKAAADRAEQAKQFVADASKYGRRIETTAGRVTSFTEYVPPADGDILDGVVTIRTGIEETVADGTKRVITSYLKPNSVDKLGVVVSEVKDGVETVTKVKEYEPGTIDVKEGDTRPVPPPGSSSAGNKPHTIDPKADGSLGRASGNHPDTASVVRSKTEWEDGSTRVEFEPIEVPDGRVFKPFEEVNPSAPGSPFRTGYDLERPDFDGAVVRVTAYFDKDGKLEAIVGSVLKDGVETIVTTQEFKPGGLGGLKQGDTRPVDTGGGNTPSTWTPPSGSGSDTKSGGTQDVSGAGAADSRPKPERGGASTSGGDASTDQPKKDEGDSSPSSGADPPQQTVTWTEPETRENGSTYKAYEVKNADGSTQRYGTQTQTSDGTTSCKDMTSGGEQDAECPAGGKTDEPTCRSSCDHIAVFLWLVGCTGTECATLPEAASDNNCEAVHPAGDNESRASGGKAGSLRGWVVNCDGAGRPGGGPIDSGDPNDPNAPDPVDPSQYTDPHNDGVTDPAQPGEGGDGSAPAAFAEDTTTAAQRNTLRDPVAPWTEISGLPGDGPPTTSDTDLIHNP